MKTRLTIVLIALAGALQAGIPLAWTVETTQTKPAQFECYRGETLDLSATLLSRGKPLTTHDAPRTPHLYWQTNGMGSAYWSAPATSSSNVLSAVWSPTNDVGASYYNCFIGAPGENYRAAFRLRMLPAPGAEPNALAPPIRSIDFATVEVANAPWATADEVDTAISAAIAGISATADLTPATNYTDSVAAGKLDATNGVAVNRFTFRGENGGTIQMRDTLGLSILLTEDNNSLMLAPLGMMVNYGNPIYWSNVEAVVRGTSTAYAKPADLALATQAATNYTDQAIANLEIPSAANVNMTDAAGVTWTLGVNTNGTIFTFIEEGNE